MRMARLSSPKVIARVAWDGVIDTTICHQNHPLAELFNITSFSIVIKPYTLARIAIYFQCHQHLPRAIYSRQGFFMICKYLSSLSSTRASWRQLKMQPKNEEICVEINSQVSHRTPKNTTTSLNCNGGFDETNHGCPKSEH